MAQDFRVESRIKYLEIQTFELQEQQNLINNIQEEINSIIIIIQINMLGFVLSKIQNVMPIKNRLTGCSSRRKHSFVLLEIMSELRCCE
jgi:hypothetical protein